MKKKSRLIGAIIGLGLLGGLIFWARGCLAVDKCLDNGGRWNYERHECEMQ